MTYRGPAVGALFALVAVFLPACGTADVGYRQPTNGVTSSVTFDQDGVLALAPSEIVAVNLHSDVDTVTLSLAGDYLDAFLDSDSVDTSSGQGTFKLHAPSSPSTFSILAVAGNASARLDVAVSATGFATVDVTVNYTGDRPIPEVAASVFLETTCAQLDGAAMDGSPLVLGTQGEQLVIPSVPTDGHVAVAVRIAHYATGCVDIASLSPNETHSVTVDVFDLPLDLAGTTLETRASPSLRSSPTRPPSPATSTKRFRAQCVAAAFPTTQTESYDLLDAMGAASTSLSDFAAARSSMGWNSATQSWLDAHTPTLTARASAWLHASANAGLGDLTGHLAADPMTPTFTPKTLGALDATKAGISAPVPFSWTGQPADVLSVTGNVTIVPSALACAGADVVAQTDVPTSTGVATALALGIDCTGLGSTLVPTGYGFDTCDARPCVAALCVSALDAMWSSGAAALSKPSEALTLAITVAAPVQVGDTANVTSFMGAWVGSFSYGVHLENRDAGRGERRLRRRPKLTTRLVTSECSRRRSPFRLGTVPRR